MTDDDLFNLFWVFHKKRLLDFAAKAAHGRWRDSEEGLNDAMHELRTEIVEHFKAVSIEDRTDAEKSILPLLWMRVKSRALDVRRKSLRHEEPGGQSVAEVEAIDKEPPKTENDSTDAAADRVAKLLTAMNQLSDMEKTVIKLTILREPPMTNDEAAKQIRTTPGTVKVRKYSALEKLRRCSENK